jgi:type IV pilus assembly protein PilA
MTPHSMNAPPTKPSALPLVALILGVIGFCFPPFFLIAIILAIISLARASEPAFAARKTLAIITLVLGVVYVPVVGILAAIAIPNFLKFQARSKQSECKMMLKSVVQMQQAYFAEHQKWADTSEELAFRPDKKSRYSYWVGPDSVVPAGIGTTSAQELAAAYPEGMGELIGAHGNCPDDCEVTMACAGNIDNDATIDVWSVSTKQRTVNGEVVPAGTPFNERDDLNE